MPDAPFQPALPLFAAAPLRALSLLEVTAALEAGIRAGGAGSLSRTGDLLLATLCARVLAERLDTAGLAVVRVSTAG